MCNPSRCSRIHTLVHLLAAVNIFLTLAWASPSIAQSVQQSGSITRSHVPVWNTSGVIADGGSSADSPITSLGVTNNGAAGFCVNSDRQSAAGRNQLCFGAQTSGPATISLQNFGTAAAQGINFVINGTVFPFPASLASITVGSTPVIGGTNGNCLIVTAALVGQQNCAVLLSGTTGTGAIVLQNSPTLAGTIGGNLIWSGNQVTTGTASFSNNLLSNGTNSPASLSGNTVVMGTVSPPVLTNTGQAWLFNSAATGANLQGDGSNFDISILNAAGSVIMQVPTGTVNPTFPGVPVLSGLGSGSCINGVGLNASNQMITVSCPGAASSIQIGTTSVISGTANDLLYNNAGTLGNAGIVTFLTAGTGISITGTTNATVALTTPVSSANGGSGNSSPAAHTIPINEGSGSQNNTGVGSTGQCLNSQGTGADPTYKSGCWVLLNTLTASNSPTLTDTSSITSAYIEYEIVFEQIIPATNGSTIYLQFQVGGVFQNGSYLGSNFQFNNTASSISSSTVGVPTAVNAANSAPGGNGRYLLSNPSQILTCKMIYGTFSFLSVNAIGGTSAGCYNGGSGAITGIQMAMSAGNITSGIMKIYGRTS
jgi:hypothetical protein